MSTASAVIFGCGSTVLSEREKVFFRESNPFGFILFARNIDNPDQVRSLVSELRDAVGRADAPVLIDQEGGRVARLRPPHWKERPAVRRFGDLYDRDPQSALDALSLNYSLIGAELAALGIDVDCAPVCDVPVPGAHDIIGDRACHEDPEKIAALASAICHGLGKAGVAPVIKHIPGHGRAMADSHLDLPRVDATHQDMAASDFQPFRALSDAPWGMTAHIVYEALDPDAPATLSAKVVEDVIRREIGFDGLLLTDDLSMKALTGSFADRAARSLAAGCDVVLHCNGDMTEMEPVASGVSPMSEAAVSRAAKALEWCNQHREAFDAEAGEARMANLLAELF
jgi:beta-N-acetylhexosaminidase